MRNGHCHALGNRHYECLVCRLTNDWTQRCLFYAELLVSYRNTCFMHCKCISSQNSPTSHSMPSKITDETRVRELVWKLHTKRCLAISITISLTNILRATCVFDWMLCAINWQNLDIFRCWLGKFSFTIFSILHWIFCSTLNFLLELNTQYIRIPSREFS